MLSCYDFMVSTCLFTLLCNDSLVLDWIARDTVDKAGDMVDGKRGCWEEDFCCSFSIGFCCC